MSQGGDCHVQGRAPVREAGGRASSSSLSTSSGLGPRLSAQSGRWWCPHWEDTPAGPGGTATCRGAVCTGAARPALSPPTAHLDAQPWAKPHAGGSPAALPCFSDLPPKGHLKHISPQRPRVCVTKLCQDGGFGVRSCFTPPQLQASTEVTPILRPQFTCL